VKNPSYFPGQRLDDDTDGLNQSVFSSNTRLKDVFNPKGGVMAKSNNDLIGGDKKYQSKNPNIMSL